jgi:hypothetical protein
VGIVAKRPSRHSPHAEDLALQERSVVEPLAIMQCAAHEDFATTQIYIRIAEALREGFGDVFPPLPQSLLGVDRSTARATEDLTARSFRAGHGIRTRDIQLGKVRIRAPRSLKDRRLRGSRIPITVSDRLGARPVSPGSNGGETRG